MSFFVGLLGSVSKRGGAEAPPQENYSLNLSYNELTAGVQDNGNGDLVLNNPVALNWTQGAIADQALIGNGSIKFFAEDNGVSAGAGMGFGKGGFSVTATQSQNFTGELLLLISSDISQYTIFKNGTQVATGAITSGDQYELRLNEGVATIHAGETLLYTSPDNYPHTLFPYALLHSGKTSSKVIGATVESTSNENVSRVLFGADFNVDSFYFFRAYKATDYPLVQCDKTFFFLYSTDHSSGEGGVHWAKGNNLDKTDLEYGGLIVSGGQAETPIPLNIPAAESTIGQDAFAIFYHTDGQPQVTKIIYITQPSILHLANWSEPIIARQPVGENHLGYWHPYRISANNYIGTHIVQASLPQPWEYSTATDPLVWSSGESIDVITGVEDGYFAQLSDGVYFDYQGIQWWVGTIHPETNSTIFQANKKVILAKSTSPYKGVSQQTILFNGEENLRHSVTVDSDEIMIYITNPKGRVFSKKINKSFLDQYI